ncbi:protein ZGRF1-like isoform X2 [Crotalus tigris]|uniref:protein ZGRF1-like isoform X2 n=1 Tax=Crotalus tigris TaxID=88082 RepID=UPI00192F8E44|nr:protein ZGRF1-like isoform X2 [Crotalus tigris]
MAYQEFIVLYTHQKTKKSKVWQDGILKAAFGGNKANLFDDKGQLLDSIFIKFQIKPGDDFESERYLITIESENVSKTDYNQSKNTGQQKLTSNPLKSLATSSLCHPKRKYSGFQVPRQVEKKKLVEEPALTSTSDSPLSSFPHQFYASSPLFSVPCQNREDVEPVSFLASTSLDDKHELVQNKKCNSNSLAVEYLKPKFQLENALVNSGYHAFSQNIRSRSKIIALLSHDQRVSTRLENEATASLKNLQFTMIQSESNPEVLLQRKSRWDAYMPSCLSDVHNAENNEENTSNLQSIEKGLNESDCVNRSQYNDHKGIPQMPPSWKLDIFPVSKGSIGSQPSDFFPSETFMNESNNSELSSLHNVNLSYGNAPKTFEDSSESSRHGIIGNLERSCPGADFANPGKQFTEVNFNLLNMLDFSDTEDNNPNENSIVPQGSVCLRQEIKNQVEVSAEKNCDVAPCGSERKDNVQLEFLQDQEPRSSGLQPALCDEISAKPVNIKEKSTTLWDKKWQNSVVLINEKTDTNTLYAQNMDVHQQLPCASRSFVMENDVDCEIHDIKGSFAEAFCSEDEQIPCLHSDSTNLVVEFHGHQVKGSAASEMMTREHCSYHKKDLQSDMTISESASKDAFFFSAQELSCPGVPEFVKSLGSRKLSEDNLSNSGTKTFRKEFNVFEEKGNKFLTKTASFKPPSQIVTNSSSNLDFTESASKEFNKDTSELYFPGADMVKNTNVPKRQQCIPVEFQSPAHYKKVFTTALIALGKVDISFYTSVKEGQQEKSAPLCSHKIATKLVMVRKEGRNKGRLFYACDAAKADRCDFFKWVEDVKPIQMESEPCIKLHDIKSIGTYLRCQRISIYEECQFLIRKMFDTQRKQFSKMKKCNIAKASFNCDSKSKLFLKLNRKEHSSTYSKDDLWVVSKTLTFEPLDTFIAYSVFFGPSSNNEVELEPLNGYSPSNWCSNMIVHALFVCNASTELTNLRNIQENVSLITLPIMQHLLTKGFKEFFPKTKERKQKFKPPALNTNAIKSEMFSPEIVINLADKIIQAFQLNKDQATAMMQIGAMMTSQEINTETGKHPTFPITIIHGVFGSGKSLLLAIVILFLVQIFEINEAVNGKQSVPWKVLVSSSTNIAVDRILLSLLDIGFEDFIRVGSIKKIAKPILPYSLHAGSGSENEQLKELLALMKEDLSPVEKMYVKKTIEQHKLGTNKASLRKVRVVGSTCAACSFPCMKSLKFPIVILDECSQMTEPSSLFPIASFECEKLILVGDPKQLPPTIQGSESAHDSGLEQTLFDRLCLMGYAPILLRTQYRCHPVIAAITNELFYEGIMLNGISETDRSPLLDWLPTLCFYNVNGSEQIEADNSFYNMAESFFIVKLIQSLIASGVDGSMMGVITLYKSQMSKIRNLFGAIHMDAAQIKSVQVSTVDAFQGAEKEIIVLSCVRTRQVGFIDSEKRVNVALTRGKRHLLIVGNLNCLRKNKLWGSVIQHCTGRKNGLQHANQCEQQLNDIVKSYFKRKMEEEAIMKKKKSKNESLSQKTNA